MISLIKKENFNIGIVQTDFEIYKEITEISFKDPEAKEYLIDLDNLSIPSYFKNKITIAMQTNNMLIGFACFEYKNGKESSEVDINKFYVKQEFKNKSMQYILLEGIIYIASEIGARSVLVNCNKENELYSLYREFGFYEIGLDSNVLSINVASICLNKKIKDKFKNMPNDYVDYKTLKIIKKITEGRSAKLYLTEDGKLLKIFNSNSFTFIKDREETLKELINLDINEVIKPKKLVYYDEMFIGYIMDYLPDGKDLWSSKEDYTFEEKIDKIKEIENVLKKLHDKKIYVCDLNPNNIFFDREGNIKLIDCDSFVIKENVVNTGCLPKYRDPKNKIVSEKTDLYALAISTLELLTNTKIKDDADKNEIKELYEKNKNKLPESFKEYYEHMFSSDERNYLSDSYENYINNIFNTEDTMIIEDEKSGKVSVIILSLILVLIATIGYLVFKYIM